MRVRDPHFDFLPVRKGQEPRGFRGANGKPAARKGEERRRVHKIAGMMPRRPYIFEAGKMNPVSHGQVRLRATFRCKVNRPSYIV
jgi:hypothetical protein